MKKIITISLIIISCNVFGQQKFSSYSEIGSENPYEIEISGTSEQDFELWIPVYSLDKLHKRCGFTLNKKNYNQFVIAIMEAEKKYKEWKEVAIENEIKSFQKKITFEFPKCDGFFYYGSSIQFDFNALPQSVFRVVDLSDGLHYWLQVRFGKMESVTNQFMTHDGMIMTFDNPEKINEFLSAISYEKIVLHFQAKDLFKD
jgi:hypothetical protein